ncbi:MAG TPA: hypothetical protein VE996_02125, partial [Terriglobales bacterium]|nr:hypothetical protein [Terriglobales bacterium]
MRRRFASGLRGNFTRGGDAETDQLRAGQHDRSCGGRADNTADYACAGDHPADGAAGELTSDGAHTYQYDAAGRLTGVDGGATARYVYDAEGRRVERAVGGQKFEEIYDLSGHIVAEMAAANGAWQRGEVFGAGRHIASYADGTTYFPHADWLGTERVRAT